MSRHGKTTRVSRGSRGRSDLVNGTSAGEEIALQKQETVHIDLVVPVCDEPRSCTIFIMLSVSGVYLIICLRMMQVGDIIHRCMPPLSKMK